MLPTLALALVSAATLHGDSVSTGADVIRAMHDRYETSWYATLRFRQTVFRKGPDGSPRPHEVWLEHLSVPGRLRIDQGSAYNGNGVIYAGDSIYAFSRGRPDPSRAGRNVLLVLGFDVYRQPVERSMAVLSSQGFDLDAVRTDTWQDRPVWVVGAEGKGAKQFWIDQERLVFVRLLQPTPAGGVQDIRFDDYRPLAGGWIAPTVRFIVDGNELMREEYFDIEADVEFPAGLFDPARFSEGTGGR